MQRQATVAYNDGFTKSCRRPCAAVSRTYWQLPTLTSGPFGFGVVTSRRHHCAGRRHAQQTVY